MKQYDVAIIGGGIAGLWSCHVLQSAGYHCILLERDTLGGAQTLASQGIIHGGTKYALTGKLSGSSEAVREMPARWQQHLAGERQPDLSAVKINTPHQWLWDAGGVSAKISHFFAGKMMNSRVQSVPANQLPSILQGKNVHQLQEPVLDVQSVVKILSSDINACRAEVNRVTKDETGQLQLQVTADGVSGQLNARRVVHAAGTGNAALQQAEMQRRPLHMLMVKGDLPPLWGHIIEASANPKLTLTTHSARDGQTLWYIGGQLAESSTLDEPSRLIERAKQELNTLFPSVDWQSMAWATLKVDRAEGRQSDGGRPTMPTISQQGNQITVWPTKLVFAPMVADEILQRVKDSGLCPSDNDGAQDAPELPLATVGEYPWDRANWV